MDYIYVVAQFFKQFNSSLDWVLSLLDHFTGLRFIFVHVYFVFIMAALRSRCGHYIFVLWFLLFCFFFFSSPNLSGCRLDVYRTSTLGVALVRIWNAGLTCTARGSLKIQDAKKIAISSPLQLCRAVS